jgi:hypothetical protein
MLKNFLFALNMHRKAVGAVALSVSILAMVGILTLTFLQINGKESIFEQDVMVIRHAVNGEIFETSHVQQCIGASRAPSNGVGLWEVNGTSKWYIVHDSDPIGQQVLNARVNEWFKIDGKRFNVKKIVDVSKSSTYESLMDKIMIGHSAAVQVCIPNSNNVRIVVGQQ